MNRETAAYWQENYPACVLTLGNITQMPYPADIFAWNAERMSGSSDAQIIEKSFTHHP